jgi:hypothetical protein
MKDYGMIVEYMEVYWNGVYPNHPVVMDDQDLVY